MSITSFILSLLVAFAIGGLIGYSFHFEEYCKDK